MANILPDFPHRRLPPHQGPFIGRVDNLYGILGENPQGTLRAYHDRAYWVNNTEIPNVVYRFYTEYHINPYRLLLWANEMDMDLRHVNVCINPWTMDLDIRADILRPAIPPFDYTRPPLHYRSMYPLPVGFYNLFTGVYMVRNSTIYICLSTAEGIDEILHDYQIPHFKPQNQEPQNEELQIEG